MLRQAYPDDHQDHSGGGDSGRGLMEDSDIDSSGSGSGGGAFSASAPSSVASDVYVSKPGRTYVPGAQQLHLSPKKPSKPKLDPLALDQVKQQQQGRRRGQGGGRKAKTARTTRGGAGVSPRTQRLSQRNPKQLPTLRTSRANYRTGYYDQDQDNKPGKIYTEVYHKSRPETLIDKVVSSLKFHVNELVTHVDGADASLERFHLLLRAQHDADAAVLLQDDERLITTPTNFNNDGDD